MPDDSVEHSSWIVGLSSTCPSVHLHRLAVQSPVVCWGVIGTLAFGNYRLFGSGRHERSEGLRPMRFSVTCASEGIKSHICCAFRAASKNDADNVRYECSRG